VPEATEEALSEAVVLFTLGTPLALLSPLPVFYEKDKIPPLSDRIAGIPGIMGELEKRFSGALDTLGLILSSYRG
jgi:hypothetical protein